MTEACGGVSVSVAVTEEFEVESLCDEVVGTVLPLELPLSSVDLLEELVGRDDLPWLDDFTDDVAQGVIVDGFDSWETVCLVRKVVCPNGKMELGVVGVAAEVVAAC